MKQNTAVVEIAKAFESKELTKATVRIEKLNDNIRANLYEIAHIIADVKTNKTYENDYPNIGEWAKDCFGYEKSMTYNLSKIGEEYTIPIINEKGKTVGYRSNLVQDGDDYTTTQIIKMLPAGHDTAKELHDNGVISPSMTVREIETAIKNATAPETVEDETDVTDEEIDAMNNYPFITIPKDLVVALFNLVTPTDENLDILQEVSTYIKD